MVDVASAKKSPWVQRCGLDEDGRHFLRSVARKLTQLRPLVPCRLWSNVTSSSDISMRALLSPQ